MNLGLRVLEAFRWSVASKVIGQLVSWILSLVVARLLTPGDYGLLAEAGVFIALLSLVSEFGLGAAVIQQQEMMSGEVLGQVFGLVLLVNLALCVLLFSVSPLVAGFFNEPRLESIIMVLSSQFILMSFFVMPQSLLQRTLRLKEKSLVELCAVLLGGLTSLYLAWTGWGVWSLVWGSLAITLAKAFGMNLVLPVVLRPTFSFRGVQRLVTFGGMMTGQRVLWSLYSQSDIFVVAKVLGEELVGIYTMAMHVASLPIQKLNGIINEVAFPAFARIQDDPEKVASHFLKGIRLISVFAFPICWGLSSIAPELVTVVLGTKWQSAAEPVQILALIMPLLMVSNVLHTAVNGLGQVRISATTLLIACVLMPSAFVFGTRFGLRGVCFAWLIAYPVVFLALLWLALPIVGVRWTEFFMAMALPALAGAFTYAAVMETKLFATGDEGSLVRMLVLILVGVLAYSGMLVSAYRDGCREVLALVRR